jgi:hypothetical protein
MWKFPLGRKTAQLRYKRNSKSIPPELRERLAVLGFVFDTRTAAFDDIYSALQIYKQTHGNLLVHQHYCVPRDDSNNPFPQHLWGLKLGTLFLYVIFR